MTLAAVVVRIVAVTVGGLLLGALTSWAQGWLSDAWSPFANSASGWTLVTALLVAACRPRWLLGAALGVVSFVMLVLGYTVGSHLRGLTYNPLFWGAAGVLAGPFIGAAAAVLVTRGRTWATAVAAGLLGGVLVGDGIYGLTVVGDTTSPQWWVVSIALGLALLVVVALRLRDAVRIGLQVGTAAVVVGGLLVAYGWLG